MSEYFLKGFVVGSKNHGAIGGWHGYVKYVASGEVWNLENIQLVSVFYEEKTYGSFAFESKAELLKAAAKKIGALCGHKVVVKALAGV